MILMGNRLLLPPDLGYVLMIAAHYQVCHQPAPTSLVGSPQALAGFTVKIFVE